MEPVHHIAMYYMHIYIKNNNVSDYCRYRDYMRLCCKDYD